MKITLRAARVNKGHTQKEAAKILGISKASLSNYERGKTYPDVCLVGKIGEAYGVAYDDVVFLPPDSVKSV
ncbi:MAG: helix-turn-helix domain-containing protein [Clostridiales Family XIII bacterium]|jgi:transcriptional regulator with XRE-family HTH domain|nr:helix-turn-helix domain-containing protein [Clostridiales Family XIII bacterium]